MAKLGKLVIILGFLGMAGICLYISLYLNLGNIASKLADFLAAGGAVETVKISGLSRITILNSIDNIVLFRAYNSDPSMHCTCIYAADKNTGEIVWSTEALARPLIQDLLTREPEYSMIPGVADLIDVSSADYLVFIRINRVLYILNSQDGSVILELKYERLVNTSLEITEKVVLLVNEKGNLAAYEKASGRILWEQPTNIKENDYVSLSISGETIYEEQNLSEQDYIVARNRVKGEKKWQMQVRKFNSSPEFFENSLIITQFDDWNTPVYLTAFESETAGILWEREFPGSYYFPHADIINEQLLFITNEDFSGDHNDYAMYSLDPRTGDLIWSFNEDQGHGEIYYKIQGEQIFIATSRGMLYSLDRYTGQIKWNVDLESPPIQFIEDETRLLVALKNKQVAAFDGATGTKFWTTVHDIKRPDFLIISDKLFVTGDNPEIKVFDLHNGMLTTTWSHNNRYRWLPGASYGFGLYDGQYLFVTGNDGGFGIDYGPKRIFRIDPETLMNN